MLGLLLGNMNAMLMWNGHDIFICVCRVWMGGKMDDELLQSPRGGAYGGVHALKHVCSM